MFRIGQPIARAGAIRVLGPRLASRRGVWLVAGAVWICTGCNWTTLKPTMALVLPSGKSVPVFRLQRDQITDRPSSNGPMPALELDYVTSLTDPNDTRGWLDEAREVWSAFGPYVEVAGYHLAILFPRMPYKQPFKMEPAMRIFLEQEASGEWRSPGDSVPWALASGEAAALIGNRGRPIPVPHPAHDGCWPLDCRGTPAGAK